MAADQIRAVARLRKVRQGHLADIPRAALADSLALGYYISPLTGLSVCGFAENEAALAAFAGETGRPELDLRCGFCRGK